MVYLSLIRKNIVLGIGCRKNYDSQKMLDAVKKTLNSHRIHEKSIASITTVEIKRDEKAIIDLAKYFDSELLIYTTTDIKKVEDTPLMSTTEVKLSREEIQE